MKVLLINAPFAFTETPTPPLGLMALAAFLLKEGIDVIIEDYIVQPYSQARVKKILDTFQPDVVGSTAVTMNVKSALRILADYKKERPELVTVMGGPHVTFDADTILSKHPYVDMIVRGEGELTFTELLRALESTSSIKDIQGISYREDGDVVHNPDRPFIEDINILPFPAIHLVSLSKYKAMGFPINMVTSRGCPHECIFCVGRRMVGRKVRYFDVSRVVDEFEKLSKMGFVQTCIVDDLFTSNKKRCIAICDEIMKRGISHKWAAFARVDTLSEELLKQLKAAGCDTLCFGIESGNQEILDRIKKKITIERCRKASELCHKYGVEPMMSFILGLPGETAETVKTTMDFAKQLSKSFGFHILAPFPGTEVRDKSEEYGLKIMTDDWDKYDANQSVVDTGTISPQEIDRVVNEFNAALTTDYLEQIGRKQKNNELLLPDEELTAKNILCLDFTTKLILNELIEKYPGLDNGNANGDVLKNFIAFLNDRIDFPASRIEDHVQRLMANNCLSKKQNGSFTTIGWA